MHLLFLFAFVSVALITLIQLDEINPFRTAALPMLDQIARYTASSATETPNTEIFDAYYAAPQNDLQLAA